MKKIAAYIAALVAAVSCIYPYTTDLGDDTEIRLVIDGDIVLGDISTFSLSSTMPLSSTLSGSYKYPQVDAFVWIEDSEGVEYPKDMYPGTHPYGSTVSIDMTDAPIDREYRIHCRVMSLGDKSDLEYVSGWESLSESPTVTGMNYTYDDNSVFVNLSVEGGASFCKWDYSELWQFHAPYQTTLVFNERTRQVVQGEADYAHFICWKRANPKTFGLGSYQNQASDALLNQRMCQFPRSYDRLTYADKFTVRVCGLSENAYEYLKNLLTISSITGSLFSPSPEDMRGNITNVSDPNEFVMGYVSVVKPSYFTYYLIPDREVYKPAKLPELFVPNTRQYDLLTWFRRGYAPVLEDVVDNGGVSSLEVLWGEKRCIDCTQSGGVLERPEDWPI